MMRAFKLGEIDQICQRTRSASSRQVNSANGITLVSASQAYRAYASEARSDSV